jgi:hypothetical protein
MNNIITFANRCGDAADLLYELLQYINTDSRVYDYIAEDEIEVINLACDYLYDAKYYIRNDTTLG